MHTLHHQSYGQGQDIVLLHGWGLNSRVWQPLLSRLSTAYRVTLIDLPGMGQSPCTVDAYDPECIATQLLAVAPPTALWLGWSLGGLLALHVAASAPARVQGLVMVASSPCFVQQEQWPGLAPDVLQQFALQLQHDHQAVVRDFLACHLRGTLHTRQLTRLQQLIVQGGMPTATALQMALLPLLTWDLRVALAQLQCPHLHILGRLDGLVPASLALALGALYPGATVRIANRSAHMPFLSETALFLQWLSEFIR